MRLLETPGYKQMGYFWGKNQQHQCSWLQYADDALILANSLSHAQNLVRLFEAWCDWAKMDIRLDKCLSFGAAMLGGKFQQILPKIDLVGKGLIPAVPLGGHFKYLGKVFDFQALNTVPREEFETKLKNLLVKISSLKIRCQTKLKILSLYIPSQFNFELKIYNFTDAFLSGVIDRMCTNHIREWLEFPSSSCVTEWVSSPTSFCGLGIPTFAQRAARLHLTKRYMLKSSKNSCIRDLWDASRHKNVLVDSLLDANSITQASRSMANAQAKDSLDHFLGLKSQGLSSKVIGEIVQPKNIQFWKQVLDLLPEHIFNFTRKAMMGQLPTLHNLKLWNCSPTNLCPKCGLDQTNKHVFSNCNSPDVLARYTGRHNSVLELIAKWIVPHLKTNQSLHCDLSVPGTSPVCDLFNGPRPDLAIVLPAKIVVGELTICHETNMQKSREYKLQKYANLGAARASEFRCRAVSVHTIEVSTLGFIASEPNFFKLGGIPPFDPKIIKDLSKAAILATKSIYDKRNI